MSGKALIILALSFSSMFILFANDFFTIAQKSTDDMVSSYNDQKALEIARTATEVILTYYWQNSDSAQTLNNHQTFFDSLDYNGGNVTSNIDIHPTDPNMYRIRTRSYFGDSSNVQKKTVTVLYGPQKLTKMASYSENHGNIWWTGNDTVKGAIYCRGSIPVYDHPTFLSDVYSKSSGFKYFNSGGNSAAKRLANEPNVDPNNLHFRTELKRPSNAVRALKDQAINGGFYRNGSSWSSNSIDTMFIELKGQRMDIKFSANGTNPEPDLLNRSISTLAPNGILYAANYVVRVKGVLDGQLTIACRGKRQKGKGKILLDDDVVYQDDPRDGASDDLLGLVAENYVEVADTPPNQTDINIHAAIYVNSKGFTAENAQTKADAGTINFFGSIIEGRRMEVGKFDPGTGDLWGYGRSYDYDERLKSISPPSFPNLQGYNVLAWYEGDSPK